MWVQLSHWFIADLVVLCFWCGYRIYVFGVVYGVLWVRL